MLILISQSIQAFSWDPKWCIAFVYWSHGQHSSDTPTSCLWWNASEHWVQYKFLCLKFKAHLLSSFTDHPALSLTEDCKSVFPIRLLFAHLICSQILGLIPPFSPPPPLRMPNIPPWSMQKPVGDLTFLQFVHQTASTFVAPFYSWDLHNMYDQFVNLHRRIKNLCTSRLRYGGGYSGCSVNTWKLSKKFICLKCHLDIYTVELR